ncbi:MAG: cob(I)yrinic acid a,c-diamide adenosyltransferase [Faecousia sp.]
MIHIYCGDGKGKTTAAVGLAVRAAGAGKNVVFTQFFKDGSSSEISVLRSIPNIRVLHCQTVPGFWRRMDENQRKKASADYTRLFADVLEAARDADLLILDEMISACNHGAVPEPLVTDFLDKKPDYLEVVLTGRDPSPALLERADYITEMRKCRHPYDQGIPARKGIEF